MSDNSSHSVNSAAVMVSMLLLAAVSQCVLSLGYCPPAAVCLQIVLKQVPSQLRAKFQTSYGGGAMVTEAVSDRLLIKTWTCVQMWAASVRR